jgi:exodeoxyribonuclease V alpha subunit
MTTVLLEQFLAYDGFNTLDRQFAHRMVKLADPKSVLVGHAAAIASAMLRRGHLCARLDEIPDFGDALPLRMDPWPTLTQWRADLEASGLVTDHGAQFLPLVFDSEGRLYLHRYFEYEQRLAEAIRARVETGRFKVIIGGPGTGKTTRILKELTDLIDLKPDLRVALAAPTGKAAKRMEESVQQANPASIRTASTIHRLLGARGDSAFFKHHADNPLIEDVVIVDEASMVDLPLMAKLLDALKPTATLILVGDPDQLASVEAGAVLADIAEAARSAASDISPLGSALVTLQTQYRYAADSGIGRLCEAIRIGDGDRAVELLNDSSFTDIRLRALPSHQNLESALHDDASLDDLRHVLELDDPVAILLGLGRSRVLCPTRQGPYGLEVINELITSNFEGFRRIRPVVLTRNDHSLQLFNGDSGVVLTDPRSGESWAWFMGPQRTPVRLPAGRLPPHETAYAMTVHRSQGSEFDRILIVLPPGSNPIMTRELLYTAVSRARKEVEIWGDPQTVREACSRKTRRYSGLIDRLR